MQFKTWVNKSGRVRVAVCSDYEQRPLQHNWALQSLVYNVHLKTGIGIKWTQSVEFVQQGISRSEVRRIKALGEPA